MAIITEQVGDIFSAPAHSLLIHACNTQGKWGAGVALSFKQKYPHAFRIYAAHCTPPPSKSASKSKSKSIPKHQRALAGTALLIPPSPSPSHSPSSTSSASSTHWIACLFTSVRYGRGRDPPARILRNTQRALQDLAAQLDALKEKKKEGGVGEEEEEGDDDDDDDSEEKTSTPNPNSQQTSKSKPTSKATRKKPTATPTPPPPQNNYAVPLNSGHFGVPWRRTKAVLEAGQLDIEVLGTDQGTFSSS